MNFIKPLFRTIILLILVSARDAAALGHVSELDVERSAKQALEKIAEGQKEALFRGLDPLPVIAVYRPQKTEIEPSRDVALEEINTWLGLGPEFITKIPEGSGDFGALITVEGQKPVSFSQTRNFPDSMFQAFSLLGPLGYRLGFTFQNDFNKRQEGKKGTASEEPLYPLSFTALAGERPIERQAGELFLRDDGVTLSRIERFPYQCIVIEADRLDSFKEAVNRMRLVLKIFSRTRRAYSWFDTYWVWEEGKFRAFFEIYVIPVGSDIPAEGWHRKIRSGGVVLLTQEEDWGKEGLREKIRRTYESVRLEPGDLWQLSEAYKAHYAMDRLSSIHGWEYKIWRESSSANTMVVFLIPSLGEVVKYFKWMPVGTHEQPGGIWKKYLNDGLETAGRYLGDLFTSTQKIAVDETGHFIPAAPDAFTILMVQKMVAGPHAGEHLANLYTHPLENQDKVVKIFERCIEFQARVLAAGVLDDDLRNYLFNIKGEEEFRGYDTGQIMDGVSPEYLSYREEVFDLWDKWFKDQIEADGQKYPELQPALKARFGDFSLKDEMKRLGLPWPQTPEERLARPMDPWKPRILELSKRQLE